MHGHSTHTAGGSLLLTASDEELRQQFGKLKRPVDVAVLLDVPYQTLLYHIYRTPPAQRYVTFSIPKASGGVRMISAPATPLKIIQAKLNQVLQAVYRPRACVHGFVRDRNVRTNAQMHVARKVVFNADLKDFFPTITFPRVRGLFMARPYGMPPKVATILAQICCHEGRLPQGAPTSPVVSNMICAKMDTQLMRLAERYRCVYTRYADDLTFSTSLRTFPHAIAVQRPTGAVDIGRDLAKVLAENWFEVNPRKVRLHDRHRRQEVTGLTTNVFPNVRRRYVRQIRAMLHAWERHGYKNAERAFQDEHDRKHRAPGDAAPSFRAVIEGKLDYLAMVKGRTDRVYTGLVKRARGVDSGFYRMPIGDDAVWVIECDPKKVLEEELGAQGTGFWLRGYGLVSCAHVLGMHSRVFRPDRPDVLYGIEPRCVSEEHDVAVLRTDATPRYELPMGDPQELHEGDDVFVLGFPTWNGGQTMHSTPATIVGFRNLHGVRRISLDTRIIKGNSGGPVVNRAGEVIGIAVTGADEDEPKFLNGVVPISLVPTLLARLDRDDHHLKSPSALRMTVASQD